MEDLPDLPLLEVFSYFSNGEKIRMLTVCKRWLSLLRDDIQQLCVYGRQAPYKPSWNHLSTQEELNDKYIVRTKELQKDIVFRLRNLKKLFIFKLRDWRIFNSLNLNSFDQLVELKMVFCSRTYPNFDHLSGSKMNFPSLKKLHMENQTDLISKFKAPLDFLNAPNLQSIVLPNFLLTFKEAYRPEKIKFILCTVYQTDQIFGNLERLICGQIATRLELEKMPRLKRVELFPNDWSDWELIRDLETQKLSLQREDLEIGISGFKEIIDPARFIRPSYNNWKHFIVGSFDHFNFSKPLSVLPWPVELENLTQIFPNLENLPENFFSVFVNIRALQIDSVPVDGQNLIRFIKKVRNLEELRISLNGFTESFYKELSQVQPIKRLYLKDAFARNFSSDANYDRWAASETSYDISYLFDLENIEFFILSTRNNLKISAKQFVKFLRATSDCSLMLSIETSRRRLYLSTSGSSYHLFYDHRCVDVSLNFNSLDEVIAYMLQHETLSENSIFF